MSLTSNYKKNFKTSHSVITYFKTNNSLKRILNSFPKEEKNEKKQDYTKLIVTTEINFI